ncbi:MAG: chloride channel protein, partial [Lautropia mirabilis]|nr:chloride channel protein [Lautropia mirabilis]
MPSADASPLPPSRLHLVAAVALTGMAAGLGAAALSWLIHVVQHLAYGHSEAQMRIVTDGTTSEHRLWALLAGGLVVALGWTCLQLKGRPVVGVNGAVAADTPARRRPPFLENVLHAVLQIVAVGSGAP